MPKLFCWLSGFYSVSFPDRCIRNVLCMNLGWGISFPLLFTSKRIRGSDHSFQPKCSRIYPNPQLFGVEWNRVLYYWDHYWPILPAPNDDGNRNTRRKSAPVPLCLPHIPHDLTRTRTRAPADGSRRLTTWATQCTVSRTCLLAG
jgi:hypothetical protein